MADHTSHVPGALCPRAQEQKHAVFLLHLIFLFCKPTMVSYLSLAMIGQEVGGSVRYFQKRVCA